MSDSVHWSLVLFPYDMVSQATIVVYFWSTKISNGSTSVGSVSGAWAACALPPFPRCYQTPYHRRPTIDATEGKVPNGYSGDYATTTTVINHTLEYLSFSISSDENVVHVYETRILVYS